MSAAELGQCLSSAFAGSSDTLALLERCSGQLLWCSEGFASQFADSRIGAVWQGWVQALAASRQPARQSVSTAAGMSAAPVSCVPSGQRLPADECVFHLRLATGERLSLCLRPVNERCCLLSGWPPGMPARQLHQYLQARNDLLVTASSLSVSEMATTLAHEINQPVGTISNLLQGIKLRLDQESPPLEAIDQALDQALGQVRFTASVINRIRDFTQARRPRMVRHDLSALLHEAFQLLDWLVSSQACRLEIVWPASEVWIVCDTTLFQQVLINLIRNAIEAMRETPAARRVLGVDVSVADAEVRIAIADRGHGLADSRTTPFAPFATSKPDGMGVGLNICRSFIELHHGRLWLAPNDDGGCTAWIALPLAHGSAAVAGTGEV